MSSSRPSYVSGGLFGDVLASYDLAGAGRRVLATVLLPIVAGMLLMSAAPGLLNDGWLVIVDGVAGVGDGGAVALARLAATVVFWLLGLLSGAVAVARGVGPIPALRRGLTALPFAVAVLGVVAGCCFVVLWMASGVATGGAFVLIAVVAAGLAALVAVRLLLGVIGWTVGDTVREPSWRDAVSFLLGGGAVPMLLTVLVDRSWPGGIPYVAPLVDAMLMLVALAAQIGLAARPHVRESVGSIRPPLWPGVALIGVAVLVPAAVVVVNPYELPVVRTHDRGPSTAMAVAWPTGGHPVIVTTGGVWFCDDDPCERFTDVSGGPPTIDGFGTASIGVDGTVVKTAVTGAPDTGGPFVQFARCVRDGCRQAWLPVRAGAREKLDQYGRVEVAGAAAPDGAIWLFVAVPVSGGEFGRYRFVAIRCADIECASPQRHEVGIADRTPEDGFPDGGRARLTVDADGRPTASFWLGWSIHRFTCAPVTCAAPQQADGRAAPPDAAWTVAGGRAVAVRAGELYDGDNSALVAPGVAARSGAVTVVGRYVYLTAPMPTTADRGFHVTIGQPAQHWRQTVWRCAGFDCTSTPLDVYEGEARRELLGVADDGRVLVVRDDRIVLLETPFSS